MKENGKTTVDVASATKLSPDTVYRYLAGKRIHRSNEAALERLLKEPAHGKGSPAHGAA